VVAGTGDPGVTAAAAGALAFITADAVIPDPTDVFFAKWAVYAAVGTAAAVIVHANNKNSQKSNIVYQIYRYNSTTGYQVVKYGISSQADFVRWSGNPRPEYQSAAFNLTQPLPGTGFYGYDILARTPDRQSALDMEKQLVDSHIALYGLRPPLQFRP
jgi:hypothetical protein